MPLTMHPLYTMGRSTSTSRHITGVYMNTFSELTPKSCPINIVTADQVVYVTIY